MKVGQVRNSLQVENPTNETHEEKEYTNQKQTGQSSSFGDPNSVKILPS
jgi:hypothetical protein